MNRYIVFATLFFVSILQAFSQQSKSVYRKHSAYKYIYKLSSEQILTLCKDEYMPSMMPYLQVKVDSCLVDSTFDTDKLPIGNYLQVWAGDKRLFYSIFTVNDVYIDQQRVNGVNAIVVYNKNGERITDAEVKLNHKLLLLDKNQKAFLLPKKEIKGFVTIEHGSLQVLQTLDKRYRRYSPGIFSKLNYYVFYPFHSYNYPGKQNYEGYIALNKPKYLPGDTVKIKGLFSDQKGRILTNKLIFYISKGYGSGQHPFSDTVSSTKNGSYLLNVPLTDSFQLNATYYVNVRGLKKEGNFPRTSFLYEDYLLDESSYKAENAKDTYEGKDTVELKIEAYDATGLPLMDGRAKIIVLNNDIRNFYDKYMQIPDTLWTLDTTLSHTGKLNIRVPESVFPHAYLSITTHITFTNSNNELHTETLYFTVNKTEPQVKIVEDQGYLSISSYDNKENKGVLFSYTKMKTLLSTDTITLPYYEPLNQLAAAYIFKTKDQGYSYSQGSINAPAPIDAYAYRTMDSVFLGFFNPMKLHLSYSIYEGTKLIQSGISDSLTFHIKDQSKNFFRLEYTYLWEGYLVNNEKTAFLYDHNLFVTMQEPAEIVPGETAQTKILVKNYKGQPAAGVNLTASSINGQFKDRNLPPVPLFQRLESLRKIYAFNNLNPPQSQYQDYYIDPDERKLMGIDTLLYYRFSYPDSGMMYHYEKSGSTQISPYVVSYGSLMAIHMIYIDSVFVFSSQATTDNSYSFKASPGYHQLKLRTAGRVIIVDSVLLKDGYKLEFSFDQGYDHSKNPHVKIIEAKPKLTQEELALHQKYMLQLKGNWRYDEVYFSNAKNIYRLRPGYDKARTQLVGPLIPYETYLLTITDWYEKEFTFEPGFLYEFAPGNTKMYQRNIASKVGNRLDIFWDDDVLQFGTSALEMKDVCRRRPISEMPEFENFRTNNFIPGSGHLLIEHDHSYELLGFTMCLKDSKDICLSANRYMMDLNDLAPGSYYLTFYYEGGFTYEDSVSIRNNYTTCIRLNNEQLKKTTRPNHLINKTAVVSEEYLNSISNKGSGEIRGKIIDEETKKPLDYVSITLEYDHMIVATTLSDDDGSYIIKNLGAGIYKIKVTNIGYRNAVITDIEVWSDQIAFVNIKMAASGGAELREVVIRQKKPLVDPEGKGGGTKTSKMVMTLPQRNVNMLASTAAGVDSRSGGPPTLRGARADGTAYYIDGVRVQGNTPVPQSAIDIPSIHQEPSSEELSGAGKNGKSIRSDFRDYAYWQPDLITDQYGEVSFINTYPDNVTSWKSYVIAMDDKQRTGVAFSNVRAYKKLYASLSVPRFMLEGDESVINGKALNYTSKPYHIQTNFLLNDISVRSSDTIIDKVIAQTCQITATSTDTISMQYNVSLENGYKDGEKEKIPVLKTGMMKTEGSFHILSRDTQMIIIPDTAKGPLTIYARAQVLDVLLEEMKQLRIYPYYCNEQMASKLIALLYEKQVMKKLDQSFLYERDIHKLIRRLEDNQLGSGMWGWWKSSTEANTWISVHALYALTLAKKMGYKVYPMEKVYDYLAETLPSYHPKKQLEVLYMLSESGEMINYQDLLKGLVWDSLSQYQKFQTMSIYKKLNPSYDISYLLKTKTETWSGAVYWSSNNEIIEDNSRTLTLMAYKILQLDSASAPLLPLVARYFLEQRKNEGWSNTYESAKIIDAITPVVIKDLSTRNKVEITINAGSYHYSADTFPFKLNLSPVSVVNIEKKGYAPVYFTSYQTYFSKEPLPMGNDYKINTYFVKGSEKINELHVGNVVSLMAEVITTRKAEYVMIEVPIPAGCTYDDNHYSASSFETHREYYKYKTVIFCETMPPGKHLFKINLQARYSGKYTLNPAKVELMYFPVYSGNTALRKIVIK